MLLEGRGGGRFQRGGDSWRAIPGGQFLAGNSWWAIPGAVKKRKRKEKKQSDRLIVMYFFDWVVGVIRYGSPAHSDSEDRVIGQAIPEGG